ncbi:GNAT family N-acetyltransferase [Halomarina pelagica]|uniref:GNAT family N-acetyltransferase n=1 Tax=Halomarina pelagica TaxID=2961599 RepID=UPI0020C217A4|nr:GNAT family N-acetyltransferase [Halomarina sp. BND7]
MTYELREEPPTAEEYVALRERAGMGARTVAAAERGLPNGVHAVTIRRDGDLVGMGRLVGDDGCFYQVVDVAVDPDHQRRGLGSRVVRALLAYLEERAPASAYVTLVADVEGYYERFGFERLRDDQYGMALSVG